MYVCACKATLADTPTHIGTHTHTYAYMSMQDPPLPFPSLSCPYSFRQSTSVTYLHEAGTKWKFVAALLIAVDGVPAPSQLPTPPATLSTYLPPPPPVCFTCVCSCCHFNVSSVLFARVTYFDFICPLARKIRQETGKLHKEGRGGERE